VVDPAGLAGPALITASSVPPSLGLVARLRFEFAVYRRLAGAYARSEMQYRVSFILRIIGTFVITVIDFAGIAIVLTRVPHLAGWSLYEIALLYGMSSVCFSLAEMIGGALDFFDEFIQAGTFDRLMIRPLPLLMQTITERFSLRRLGRASQGVVVMLVALRSLPVVWTWDKALMLGVSLVSGIAIFFAIFVLGAVFCFWSVQGREATNVFTYGGDFMSSYPLDLFNGWLRRFVTFIMPLAFVNYYPALYILDRQDTLGLPSWTGLLSPAVAGVLGLLAWRAWALGVSRYQSTGT
jgi:ABC-2 type transport system permease protein